METQPASPHGAPRAARHTRCRTGTGVLALLLAVVAGTAAFAGERPATGAVAPPAGQGDVAGLVLVDAWNEAIRDISTPAQWAALLALNAAVPPELAGQADYETIDFGIGSAVMRRAAAARPLPPLPLAVLARARPLGIGDDLPILTSDAFEEIWRVAQRRLSDLAPGAAFIVAEESAHYIQLEQPDLVLEAVRDVVTAVRGRGSR